MNFVSFCILSFAINYLFGLVVRRGYKLLILNPKLPWSLFYCWLHIHCCRVSKFCNFLPLRLRFSLSTLFTAGQLLLPAAVVGNCGKTLNNMSSSFSCWKPQTCLPHFLVNNLRQDKTYPSNYLGANYSKNWKQHQLRWTATREFFRDRLCCFW